MVQLYITAGSCNETISRLLGKGAGFGEPENAGH